MITLLTGENSFEIERELQSIIADFDGEPEKIDGNELELRNLPDLLTGSTLFLDKRMIIIRNLSENTSIWADFGDWLTRTVGSTELILVESKPDKRTRTFKELKKLATVKEYAVWTDADVSKAVGWVIDKSKEYGLELNKKCAQLVVNRVGLDQWKLLYAIEKLSLLDSVNETTIADVIDANPSENVFNLFEAALNADAAVVQRMIKILEATEDPYRLFGLLSGQAFQLAALTTSNLSANMVAKDISAHPYALSKLSPYAKKLGKGGAKKVVAYFAQADDDIKLSVGEPWLLIERALLNVAAL
jgi:DNA polymerase III delta subunit